MFNVSSTYTAITPLTNFSSKIEGITNSYVQTSYTQSLFFTTVYRVFCSITPCEAIEIHSACGNVEDFNDFQIQHYSFHNHPSKRNQV